MNELSIRLHRRNGSQAQRNDEQHGLLHTTDTADTRIAALMASEECAEIHPVFGSLATPKKEVL
jgi:hypothetical protein